ncbi:MAG TPA: DUF11 domain-containing protein [Longimicrobium sp.]|nr:DUF11 domain-containing protein [Longimicrobium sp.]
MALACAAIALACGAAPLHAAPGVTVTMTSSPKLTLDSNNPCTDGPRSAYVHFRVTNTSGAALTNLKVVLSGFASGIVLAGSQPATQYIGGLAAGASRTVFWFVTYPCTFGNAATLTATVTDNTPGSTAGSGTVTTASMISANAGGILVSTNLGAGAVVGQLIYVDVNYTFGGASAGDTYDLQPAGNFGFSAGCFQLQETEITTSIVTAIPANSTSDDRLYFTASTSQTGTNKTLTARFWFKYKCANTTSTIQPYSNQLSGTQLKYAGNYSTFVGPTLPGATNPFTITKSASSTQLAAGGSVTYTITITNPSSFASVIDSIVDVLPAGVTYNSLHASSGVTAANSGSVPSNGATDTLRFRGSPSTSYAISAGGTLTLVYNATVTSTPGQYTNSATAYGGSAPIGPATSTVTVGSADVSATKTGPASVVAGDTIRYVITTANLGANTSLSVVIRDTLPAGVTFVSATNGGTHASGVVTWPAIASLANGASRVDTVVVVAPFSLTTLTNKVAASAATYDPVPANNNGQASGAQVVTTLTVSVDVNPKGGTINKLAGTGYSQVFTVQNLSDYGGSYDLLARRTGSPLFLTLDSIRGTGITAGTDSARVTIAANTTYSVTVWYTVAFGDTATNRELLRARLVADTTMRSEGWVDVHRIRPTLSLLKGVSPGGTVLPGTDLTYTITFSNLGEAAASGVVVGDDVPPELWFKFASVNNSLPAGVTATVQYSNDAGATWTYVPVSGGCGAPSGYDGCVDRIRWVLAGKLTANQAASTGTLQFVARIQ